MIPRYELDYRKLEVSKICRYAQRGDPLASVEIAGKEKSNITNFLCKDPYGYKSQYLTYTYPKKFRTTSPRAKMGQNFSGYVYLDLASCVNGNYARKSGLCL